jgi:hypothetical protein
LVIEFKSQPRVRKSDPYVLTEKGRVEARKIASWDLAAFKGPRPSPLMEDLDALKDNKELSATDREQLILARLGQGEFRKGVLRANGGRCCVTAYDIHELLRASHIKHVEKATIRSGTI